LPAFVAILRVFGFMFPLGVDPGAPGDRHGAHRAVPTLFWFLAALTMTTATSSPSWQDKLKNV